MANRKNMLWLAIEVQTFLSLVAEERGMRGAAFMWRRVAMTNSFIELYLNLHWITKQKAD